MAIHAFCHVIWWGIIGFAVVLAITEATKPWASRYRPDYMSRCNPAQRKAQVLVAPGKPLGFAQTADCDPMVAGTDFVKDGRYAAGLVCGGSSDMYHEAGINKGGGRLSCTTCPTSTTACRACCHLTCDHVSV